MIQCVAWTWRFVMWSLGAFAGDFLQAVVEVNILKIDELNSLKALKLMEKTSKLRNNTMVISLFLWLDSLFRVPSFIKYVWLTLLKLWSFGFCSIYSRACFLFCPHVFLPGVTSNVNGLLCNEIFWHRPARMRGALLLVLLALFLFCCDESIAALLFSSGSERCLQMRRDVCRMWKKKGRSTLCSWFWIRKGIVVWHKKRKRCILPCNKVKRTRSEVLCSRILWSRVTSALGPLSVFACTFKSTSFVGCWVSDLPWMFCDLITSWLPCQKRTFSATGLRGCRMNHPKLASSAIKVSFHDVQFQ